MTEQKQKKGLLPWLSRLPEAYFQAGLLFIYTALLIFIIPHHEAWRDETSPWDELAQTGLIEFFTVQLRATTHPPLWHLILSPFVKSGFPFHTIYVIHGIIAVAIAFTILHYAPFSRTIRALWIFSLPIAYEFAVVARDYGITTLLLLSVAAAYPRRLEKPLTYGCFVFLLTQAHFLTFMVCAALGIHYLIEIWQQRAKASAKHVIALGLMAFGGILTLILVWPTEDLYLGGVINTEKIAMFRSPINALFSSAIMTWLPYVQNIASALFGTIPSLYFLVASLCIFASLFLIGTIGLSLRGTALTALALTFAAFFYIELFKYSMFMRHFFILSQIHIFALWISSFTPAGKERIKPALRLLAPFLFYSVFSCAVMYANEYKLPFSSSKDVASFLKEHKLDDRPIVFDLLFSLSAYVPSSTCLMPPPNMICERGMLWRDPEWSQFYMKDTKKLSGPNMQQMDSLPGALALRYTIAKFGNLSGKVYVLGNPLTKREERYYGITEVAAFTNTLGQETSWIYLPKAEARQLNLDKP